MAPALILDAHVPPQVATLLRRRGFDALAMAEWYAGAYVDFPDHELLRLSASEKRIFVSYDVHTIAPLLRMLSDAGVSHAGVILISSRTFRQNDISGIARALEKLLRSELPADLTNYVTFLRG